MATTSDCSVDTTLPSHFSHETRKIKKAEQLGDLEPRLKEWILNLQDVPDLEDLPPIFNKRIRDGARGIYCQTRKGEVRFRYKEGVWEFGRQIDFSDHDSVAWYLEKLHKWLMDVRMPCTLLHFTRRATQMVDGRAHRRVAYLILARAGVQLARYVLKACAGTLTQDMLDEMHSQSFESIAYVALVAGFLAVFSWFLARVARSVDSVATQTGRVMVKTGSMVDGVADVVDMVRAGFDKVWQWTKDLWSKLKQMWADANIVAKKIIKGVMYVVLFFIAVAYAQTLFPDIAKAIKRLLMGKMKINPVFEPQAGSRNWLKRIVEMFRSNFAPSAKNFWKYCDKLPKLVSLAKAVEYIMNHAYSLFYTILEGITGRKYPKNQRECDVVAFIEAVEKLWSEFHACGSMDVEAASFKSRCEALNIEMSRLRHEETTAKEALRPYFTNQFSQTCSRLVSLGKDLDLRLQACRKRPVPVWVYLRGPPNTGKSFILEGLMRNVWAYLEQFGDGIVRASFSPAQLFVVPQKETYYDGYDSQPFVVIDDLFQQKDTQIRSDLAAQLINMVSPLPYSLLVATPENKGHKHFTSIALFTTTNLKDDEMKGSVSAKGKAYKGANLGLEDPEALAERRTVIVDVPARDTYLLCQNAQQLPITLKDLAALIGECIIARHSEHHVEAPVYTWSERVRVDFDSDRLTLRKPVVVMQAPESDGGEPGPEVLVAQGRDKGKEHADDEEPDPDYVSHCRFLPDSTNMNILHKGLYLAHYAKSLYHYSRGDDFATVDMRDRYPERQLRYKSFISELRLMKCFFDNNALMGILPECPGVVLLPLGPRCEGSFTLEALRGAWYMWFFSCTGVAPCIDDVSPDQDVMGWRRLLAIDPTTLVEHWASKGSDFYQQQRTLAESRISYTWACLTYFSLMAAGFVIGWKLVSMLLPKAAYEAQTDYPDQAKLREVKKSARKRAGKRQRAEARQNATDMKAQSDPHFGIIANNLVKVDTLSATGGVVTTFWGLMLGGTTMVAPGHAVPDKDYSLRLGVDGFGPSVEFGWKFLTVTEGPSDLIYVTFPESGLRAYRSIRGFFLSKLPDHGDLFLVKPVDKVWQIWRSRGWAYNVRTIYPGDGRDYSYKTDLDVYDIPNKSGMCGLPYVTEDGKVVGIHMAGAPATRLAGVVSVQVTDLPDIQDQRLPSLEAQSLLPNRDGIKVLGRLDARYASYVPTASKIRRSQFDVASFPIPETTDCPALLDKKGDVQPLAVALSKFEMHRSVYRSQLISDYGELLPKTFRVSNIRRLTIEEAIYGIPGWIDSLDFTTSAGYRFKKLNLSRRQLCFDDQGNPRIHPLLRRDIERSLDALRCGKFIPAIYEETLKDEIRPLDRVLAGNTRLFAAGDLTSLVVTKMYLGALYVELTKDPVGTPLGLGLNPHSSQWGMAYSQIRREDDYLCLAGDFGSYDIRRKVLGDVHFTIFVMLLLHWEELPLVIRMNTEGEHVLGSMLFERLYGTNSGCFITSLLGSVDNWCLHRAAFLSLYPDGKFETLGKKFTGDDSIIGVPPRYSNFNMVYLTRYMKDTWDMNYTAPDKSAASVVEWKDAVYLKRKFVPGHAGLMAPLNEGSIANMIKWTMGEHDSVQMESVLNSCLQEMWHYGEARYEPVYKWACSEVRRLNIECVLPDWRAMLALRSKDYETLVL